MFDLPLALMGTMFFSGWLTTIFSFVLVIALIIEVANDQFILGYFSVFVYALALAIFTPTNPFLYIWHNPLDTIGFVIGYILIGGVYSVIKYRAWLNSVAIKIQSLKLDWIELYKSHGLNISVTEAIPDEFSKQWKNYLYDKLRYDDYKRIKSGFDPGRQKDLILNWIAFWPFSAVGLLIHDPLERFVNWIYDELVAVYRNIYVKIVSKFINIDDLK